MAVEIPRPGKVLVGRKIPLDLPGEMDGFETAKEKSVLQALVCVQDRGTFRGFRNVIHDCMNFFRRKMKGGLGRRCHFRAIVGRLFVSPGEREQPVPHRMGLIRRDGTDVVKSSSPCLPGETQYAVHHVVSLPKRLTGAVLPEPASMRSRQAELDSLKQSCSARAKIHVQPGGSVATKAPISEVISEEN